MNIYYIAWLRNRAGKAQEAVTPPSDVTTLAGLVAWLCSRGAEYEALFSYRSIINASVNGTVVQDWHTQKIGAADEISFFSPMAGG